MINNEDVGYSGNGMTDVFFLRAEEQRMNFSKLVPYIWMLGDGLLTTIKLTVLSAVFGFLIAVILVLMAISKKSVLTKFVEVYSTGIRAMPMLLQLFIVYFAFPQILGNLFNLSAYSAAVIALSFNGAAYYAEVMRGGIISIDKGQQEAAKALGIGRGRILAGIVFPQAMKRILPSMLSEFVLLFKETALVSQIGVKDLFYTGTTIGKNTYSLFEPYIAVAVIYYVIVMLMAYGTSLIEKRLRISD